MAEARPSGNDAASTWYKDAVFYELHVRAFADSNGDGIGDFQGLIGKLDYLRDLGVTAIWLLPFFPSPLLDDGYDIADYTSVHPAYGTLEDFQTVLGAAHARGLRVIVELVLNHTSDQHPWFQRARRAPAGSPEREWYVWSDSPDKYGEARVIFQDYEGSNWAWDPVAEAYFWHRFYAHQPDLNYENPAVRQAMFEVVDFWLELGVDGLRLDAVPYILEQEGTSSENLKQTHQVLKDLRARIDARYPGRMLLAEANQWPEDAAAYFGDGDECQMAFHFPPCHGCSWRSAPRIGCRCWTSWPRPRRFRNPASGRCSCATTRTSGCWWSPTCPASARRWNSILARGRVRPRSNCSGGPPSGQSIATRTSSRSVLMPSTGSP